jgi:hypothetical protein
MNIESNWSGLEQGSSTYTPLNIDINTRVPERPMAALSSLTPFDLFSLYFDLNFLIMIVNESKLCQTVNTNIKWLFN